jgi:mannosyltransferase OCH1-like enzyme
MDYSRSTESYARMEIPAVIHQTWRTTNVPSTLFRSEWVKSWTEMNPRWERRLWTDYDIDTYVRTHLPSFYRKTFSSYDRSIKKVDAWRYLILAREGGVYVDMDCACLRPIDSLLQHRDFYVAYHHWRVNRRPLVCNSFMASSAGQPFWEGITDELSAVAGRHVLEATGPIFLTRLCYRKGVIRDVDSHETFFPTACFDDAKKTEERSMSLQELRRRYPISLGISFWTGSWIARGEVREW